MSEDLTKKLTRSDSEKLTIVLTTVQNLVTRIDHLEQQADERRYDTRPLWEKLQADIAELKEAVHNETSEIKTETSEIKTETREIKRSLRDLSRKQSILNDTILQVHSDLRDIDERLHAIENTHNQQNSQT